MGACPSGPRSDCCSPSMAMMGFNRSERKKAPQRLVLRRVDMRPDQDFGARDIREGEKESNFAEKQLYHADTEHVVSLPEAGRKLYTLREKQCNDLRGSTLLEESQIMILAKQIGDWKIVEGRLRMERQTKDFSSGCQLCGRVGALADQEGHHPDLHLTGFNNVLVEIYSHSAGGLTENDFILASKIDLLDIKDLLPEEKKRKQKFWA